MTWTRHLLIAVAGLLGGLLPWPRSDAAESPETAAPAGPPAARQIEVLASQPVGRGSATTLRPVGRRPGDRSAELIIHFHGAVAAVRTAMERAGHGETVLVVTMPGLSTAYAKPFQNDPALFVKLLEQAWPAEQEPVEADRWQRITLSCFSAGYGAVREILRSPAADRVDGIVAADSIYAGVDREQPRRTVSPRDMAGFLAFARQAAAGQRVFVIAHSAQRTPYASTTETADFLLASLGLRRTRLNPDGDEPFARVSQCREGGLLVTGYSGESAEAHLNHLRILGRHWAEADDLRRGHGQSRREPDPAEGGREAQEGPRQSVPGP